MTIEEIISKSKLFPVVRVDSEDICAKIIEVLLMED